MKKIYMLFIVLLATVSVVGCNPFGNDDDDTYTGPVTVNAPANAAAFNGVKLNINPTITFASDGTTNTFTYVNNSGDSSAFPDAAGATLSGTFTYTPDASVKNKGVVAFVFADTSKNFSLNLMNFSGFSSGITSLEATKVGDSSGAVYKVQVAEGTLAPVPATTSITTGTSTDTSTDTGTGTSTGGTDTTIPTSMQGQVMNLTFAYKQAQVPNGFPYNNADVVKFAFSSSSILVIGTDNRSLGTPKKYSGSEEIVWFDSQYNVYYALSFKPDGSFNEVNVYSNPATPPVSFYGQFQAL